MSILLKEYGSFVPKKDEGAEISFKEASFSDLTEPVAGTLMVDVEGIHSHPFHTRNFTRYMPDALKESIPRWTNPYLKPLIKYHNDQDGKIIGRVYHTEYAEHTSVEGVGGLIFTIAVPDQEAEHDVLSRLLETVSIGVSASDVRCSVCGAQITDATEGCPNGHIRGTKTEDGQYCFWDIYAIDPKEISYVIVPSDPFAKNIRTYRVGEQDIRLAAGDDGTQGVSLKEQTGGNNPTEMDLEKQLQEAKARIEELEKQLKEAKGPEPTDVEAMKAENAQLKEDIAKIQAELNTLKESGAADKTALTAAESAKAEAEAAVEAAKAETDVIRQEKEAAEANGLKTQEAYRTFVTGMLNDLRKIAGKSELKEEEITSRSMESLQDAIKDVREEIVVLRNINFKEGSVPNPTLPPKDGGPTKTEQKHREVNLSEGIEKLFRSLV